MNSKIQQEIKNMVATQPDYIGLKRFDYSLAKLEEKYPDECPRGVIASALQLTEAEVAELHAESIAMLRRIMLTED